jgi:hypothetical protein
MIVRLQAPGVGPGGFAVAGKADRGRGAIVARPLSRASWTASTTVAKYAEHNDNPDRRQQPAGRRNELARTEGAKRT